MRLHPIAVTAAATIGSPFVLLYVRRSVAARADSAGVRRPLDRVSRAAIAASLVLAAAQAAFPGQASPTSFSAMAAGALFAACAIGFSAASLRVAATAGKASPQGNGAAGTRPAIVAAALSAGWYLALAVELSSPFAPWDAVLAASSVAVILAASFGFLGPVSAPAVTAEVGKKPSGAKYAKSGLPGWMADRYRAALADKMEKGRLFVDPELDARKLAASLGISVHHLSRVVNETMGASFYAYLSSLRLAEARRLLEDPASGSASIAEISLRSGFSTLSTFNSHFKRAFGSTPREHREKFLARTTFPIGAVEPPSGRG